MSSIVYFKFKANLKNDSIPFDGSAISVKDLKSAIRTKCCLYSSDFDLKLEDSNGKAYVKDDELIPKYTSIVVRRVPKLNSDVQKKKVHAPDEISWREAQKTAASESHPPKHVNLADSDLPEEEKIKIMMERSSEAYSEKNYAVKAKPYGVPPAAYVCHKCGLSGHWIHNCPGVRDKTGKMMDVKNVKRPTGIPQDFLLEVEAGTPGAYLGKSGRYMVPIKDAEAYALGKKDKRPFSLEENPPYVPSERTPPKQFICPLCNNMFRDAVLVSCCGTTYCNDCIMGHVFDAQILGSHRCPNCSAILNDHESSVFENALVRSMIRDWLANETVVPEPDNNPVQHDIFKAEDDDKSFVNNRRVLKPKQVVSAPVTQPKPMELVPGNQARSETQSTSIKDQDTIKTEAPPTSSDPSENSMPNPPAPSVASPHDYENVNELPVADKASPVVTPNTCTDVVASAPCTTFVAASRQSLLAVTSGLSSTQFPCISYSSSSAVVPAIIPSINGSTNNLLNAIYNMRVGNIQTPVVAPPAVVPVPFQGSLVGGADWAANAALAASGTQAAGIVDPLLPVNSSQTAFSIVSGQAIPSAIPTALPAPMQAIDGRKVLSKEEFYRLKVEMLNSTRRRHRHRSRSRSPGSSHRRLARPEVLSRRHRYERNDWERRDRYRPSADYETERSHRHHYEGNIYYESRRDGRRAAESRLRSEYSSDIPSEYDRYYQHDRRFVRSRHPKPISIVRSSSRERAVYFSPRSGSLSPPRRAYRELHRFREPHGDSYQLPGQSVDHAASVSPNPISVVPQYDLSDPESNGPKAPTERHEIPTDVNEPDVSLGSHDSQHKVRPGSLITEWPSPTDDREIQPADSFETDFDKGLVIEANLPGKSKDKKHKKHKHKHHSEKRFTFIGHCSSEHLFRKSKVHEGEAMDVDTHVWVASNAIKENATENLTEASALVDKKHKKHKKHKHSDPEKKKKKQERKERKRREQAEALNATE
ncbi:E3 ubiquitin-protein ligase RBBP6 [Fasciola gigantica]|uniref:E3 ubiquitin-protein ligase RBBP6 n=1 Tax=Fasciola gigantica TaxID=46835 RepID=A0A504YDK1_FASGI|nr:E3 ubiquitin-protein ligase RBBP6 [Fasciola gigantica]